MGMTDYPAEFTFEKMNPQQSSRTKNKDLALRPYYFIPTILGSYLSSY